VNEFVDLCRSEWKRLGVPDPVGDEMAAELETDLEEAAAEGASAEDVLGESAADPRSFAAAWAAERGVVQGRPRGEPHLPRSRRLPAAIAALALVAISGAVLVIASAPAERRQALGRLLHANGEIVSLDTATPGSVWIRQAALSPDRRKIAFGSRVAGTRDVFVANADGSGSLDGSRVFGSVLLITALVGLLLIAMWMWVGPALRSRPSPIGNGRTGRR
jgi:hypothetical protein